jgi:predicted TIM-barrel fold metal-dependent hydrolase
MTTQSGRDARQAHAMTEQERYEQSDLPFYHARVARALPPKVLDFHAHIWRRDQWRDPAARESATSAGTPESSRYVVMRTDYGAEDLLRDAQTIFPDRDYSAVVFGQPTPAVDTDLTNAYVTTHSHLHSFYPLMVVGRDKMPVQSLKERILRDGFYGYKVFICWTGDDYRGVRVRDMIGPAEMELADELGLIVLLHVPSSRRLADASVQRDVREYASRYRNAQVVLAHCGRCYHPDEMRAAVASVADLENVYLDTAMVMEPAVLQMAFEHVGPRRVLFGTDFPVAAMRGRRVYAMDHWVDVVLEGYAPSRFRIAGNDIRATFMAYEIAAAIELAGQMAGLSGQEIQAVFYENGMNLVRRVMGGRQCQEAESRP